tara:strand:- start:1105 stop:1998 length:894 start_codon:yes stop_codon:yes gene_type:complete
MDDAVDVGSDAGVESAPVSADVSSAGESTAGDWDGWDDWDGAVGTLPENIRHHGSRIHHRLSADFDSRAQEFREIADVYNAVIREHEDPRVAGLTAEREKLQEEFEAYKAKSEPVQQQYTTLQQQHEQYTQMVARNQADQFWVRHADLKEAPEKLEKFKEFLTPEGQYGEWDADTAVELLELPQEILDIAVQAKKDGVTDKWALKLAKAEMTQQELQGRLERDQGREAEIAAQRQQIEELAAQQAARQPRPAARLTNGAATDTRPEIRQRAVSDAGSLEEQRILAARHALRVHPGGK